MFILETLIAITVALTTAFGGLVAEDLIARDAACTVSAVPDLWSPECTSPSRLGWFVGTLVVLIVAMAVRAWLIAHNGTLYYLRLLPAESADRMRAAVDVANARSLDFRSATGWFGTDHAVVDLRREVDHVSDELERAMNDDDDANDVTDADDTDRDENGVVVPYTRRGEYPLRLQDGSYIILRNGS